MVPNFCKHCTCRIDREGYCDKPECLNVARLRALGVSNGFKKPGKGQEPLRPQETCIGCHSIVSLNHYSTFRKMCRTCIGEGRTATKHDAKTCAVCLSRIVETPIKLSASSAYGRKKIDTTIPSETYTDAYLKSVGLRAPGNRDGIAHLPLCEVCGGTEAEHRIGQLQSCGLFRPAAPEDEFCKKCQNTGVVCGGPVSGGGVTCACPKGDAHTMKKASEASRKAAAAQRATVLHDPVMVKARELGVNYHDAEILHVGPNHPSHPMNPRNKDEMLRLWDQHKRMNPGFGR